MRRWFVLTLLCAVVGVACLDDFDVEGETYPCRKDADCVDGYRCDVVRWVCVESSMATLDAGFPDAGTSTTSTTS
ncbi:MAG: hypothetical protein RIT81_42760 [Deltaproteobacteria bacterium]